ncbi:hypothetical protein R3P38DRAFT_3185448 [Favolaschia claudopus]|uniref:Uncharacterized protein n=1 Tax=Favolaschia claudopus TaxID=2862362 RepID=A0AAV9ZI95_9AGAR
MPQAIQVDLHTHIHHFLPPTMTAFQPASSSSASSTALATELQDLVALVGRLSTASAETMRLAVEVQTRLSVVLAGGSAAAPPPPATPLSAIPAATIPAAATPNPTATIPAAATPNAVAPTPTPDPTADDPAGPLFVRGIPKTPAELERDHPPGSGEVWYVVILGREPGLYAKAADADYQCNGIPHQYKVKKTSRTDAISFYRSLYNGPEGEGVEKWNEVV